MSEIPTEQLIESIRGYSQFHAALALASPDWLGVVPFRAETIAISDMENTPLAMISTRMIRISKDEDILELLLPRALCLTS